MVSISHKASTFTNEMINTYFNTRSNQIQITLQSQSHDDEGITLKMNRILFTKGCGSEELAEACINKNDKIQFQTSNQLTQLLERQAGQSTLKKFIIYLATGKLEFDMRQFNTVFLLACTFKVRLFFHCLIDQNIKIPFDNKQSKRIILFCCFNMFSGFLNEEGRYNFVWWLFRKFPKIWYTIAENELSQDISVLEGFIYEYTNFKVENNYLNGDDIDSLIDLYKVTGKSTQESKRKVKMLIKWQMVPIEVLQTNKLNLKFTEDQIRKILQLRLNKLSQGTGAFLDHELQELKDKRNKLKKQFEESVINQGVLLLKKELTKCGVANTAPPQNYNQPQKQKNKQQNYQFDGYPSLIHSQNLYLQHSNAIPKNQQQELRDQIQLMLDNRQSQNKQQYKPNFTKKQQPPINYRDSYNAPPPQYPPANKSSAKHYQPSCVGNKTVSLNCGCKVCYNCIGNYYITKSQKYEYLGDPNFKFNPKDFKNYGISCYLCKKVLNEIDAVAYNSV